MSRSTSCQCPEGIRAANISFVVCDLLSRVVEDGAKRRRPQTTRPPEAALEGDTHSRLTNIGASNGLLRQYFPKGTDLGVHSSEDLDWVAQELNDRPRKRLAFKNPIELIGDLLLQ
jgi:hypothetical protein